jgi:hypothetical protein
MLDPDLVLSTLVTSFQSIPALVTELGGADKITGHFYLSGAENSLERAIYSMPNPSILVAYLDLLGGNFNGMTIWKHRIEAYIRPRNAATAAAIETSAASGPHLAWLMMHSAIPPGTQNIRQLALLAGSLQLMDTPTLTHKIDENRTDLFCWAMVFPEHGDD